MLVAVALSVLFAAPACANTGVPIVALAWPIAWLSLLPVVLIEAFVATRVLRIEFRRALDLVTGPNVVSTAIGIPGIWLLPSVVGFSVSALGGLASSLFGLRMDQHHYFWPAVGGAFLTCLPCFLMSVMCEYLVARRQMEPHAWPRLRRWAWQANALSYVPIFFLFAAYFLDSAPGWFGKAYQAACMSNLNQIKWCIHGYQQQHHDRIPVAADFAALMKQLSGCEQEVRLRCPASGKAYLFNAALSGRRRASIKRPSETPMLRDAEPHLNTLRGVCVVFADGQSRMVSETDPRLKVGDFR